MVRNVRKETGNVVYTLHRLTEDPKEFWMDETRESKEAPDAHESSERFGEYKDKLGPLVDSGTVLFGDAPGRARLRGVTWGRTARGSASGREERLVCRYARAWRSEEGMDDAARGRRFLAKHAR